MRLNNLLRYAVRILNDYSGDIPLAGFLKNYFRQNPQMGSKDRKQVSEMIYCFYRLGHTLKNISAEERILTGLFLCNNKKEPILESLQPEWNELVDYTTEKKIEIVRQKFPDFNELEIFPWKEQLSAGIDHHLYCLSFLDKPRLFIRVRPGFEKSLTAKLQQYNLDARDPDPQKRLPFKSFSFDAATRLDEVIILNREAVIQDLGSQRTALYLKQDNRKEFEAWDCCTGSGGKSILMSDLYPGIKLTVSDIRESILKNCMRRLADAGIEPVRLFKTDLTDPQDIPRQSFNFIIADLPCTGSGTWSRTPEALYYFKPDTIKDFRQRQEKILANITTRLKPGGILVYLTCSVFAEENENLALERAETGLMKIEREELIAGYLEAADSMYASRFIKLR
jgi:16S rRNA (cytosine967-C5)-methyltransferase